MRFMHFKNEVERRFTIGHDVPSRSGVDHCQQCGKIHFSEHLSKRTSGEPTKKNLGAAGLEPAKSRGDASFTGWCDCRSATHPKQNPPYGPRTRSTTVTGWRADPYTYGSRNAAKI